ncbi:MAG: cytochrome c biogenesis protein CcdA [Patescibacteria group bacterium]
MLVSLVISFLAGILTVLAPCSLPLLPIIIGSSAKQKNLSNLFIIVGSLSVSVFVITLLLRSLLRFNPLLEDLDDSLWRVIAGSVILLFGMISLFPVIWNKISLKLSLQRRSDNILEKSKASNSPLEPIFLGLALGPVFSSCSPTFFVIVGLLLAESNFNRGVLLLLAYTLGLASVMLLIGFLGRTITTKLRWAANPDGWFKKAFGVILIIIGITVITGLDRQFETYLLDRGFYDGIGDVENNLSENGSVLIE